MRRAAAWLACAAALAIFAAHALGYFFLLDDFALIGEGSSRSAIALLDQPLFNFYRPAEHLWIKLLFHVFGWGHPGGYVAMSLVLHACGAWLVTRLALTSGLSARASWLAGLLFLLSPWATEPYFWMSGGFDLIATVGMLAALVCGLEDRLPLGLAAAAVALLAKEIGVLVAPVFLLAVALLRGPRALARRLTAMYGAGLILLTAAYLAIRERMLPGLGSAYGTFGSLVRSGGPVAEHTFRFARAFLVPLLPHIPLVPIAFAVVAAVLIVLAFLERPRFAALALLVIGASLLPVIWVPMNAGSSAANRFLYFGGAWLAVLLAAGADRLTSIARDVVLVFVVAVALGSVGYQARIWREAGTLSRSSIDQLRPYAGSSQPLFVTNLPWSFTNGPYIINAPALRYYFGAALPPVRARTMAITFDRPESTLAFWPGEDRELKPAPGERSVTLALPVWVPETKPAGGIDEPASGATVEQPFTIRGWAIDANARERTGIDTVRIYAYPEGGSEPDAVFLGTASYGEPRPDIAARFGARFDASGFRLLASGLRPGRYRLVATPRDHLTRRTEQPIEMAITVRGAGR